MTWHVKPIAVRPWHSRALTARDSSVMHDRDGRSQEQGRAPPGRWGSANHPRTGALPSRRGRRLEVRGGVGEALSLRLGAPPAERGERARVAASLDRIAAAIERVAAALEQVLGAEGRPGATAQVSGEGALPDDGGSAPGVECVTQKNCMVVLGLTPRRFLELLRRDDAPPVVAVGKIRMVRREAMLAYIARLGAQRRGAADHDQDPDGAESVLREIGCAPVRR